MLRSGCNGSGLDMDTGREHGGAVLAVFTPPLELSPVPPEPQALGFGIEPMLPRVTELVRGHPPAAPIGARPQIERQLACLPVQVAVGCVADRQLAANGSVDLDGGPGNERSDLLYGQVARLRFGDGRDRAEASHRND